MHIDTNMHRRWNSLVKYVSLKQAWTCLAWKIWAKLVQVFLSLDWSNMLLALECSQMQKNILLSTHLSIFHEKQDNEIEYVAICKSMSKLCSRILRQGVYFIIVLWADFLEESYQIDFSGLLVLRGLKINGFQMRFLNLVHIVSNGMVKAQLFRAD